MLKVIQGNLLSSIFGLSTLEHQVSGWISCVVGVKVKMPSAECYENDIAGKCLPPSASYRAAIGMEQRAEQCLSRLFKVGDWTHCRHYWLEPRRDVIKLTPSLGLAIVVTTYLRYILMLYLLAACKRSTIDVAAEIHAIIIFQ